MKTAKLGALFLMSVLALAGIGAGYASWTDTITIDGTVNTGNVDWSLIWVSGTWVYKVLDATNEIVIQHQGGLQPGVRPAPPSGFIPITRPDGTTDNCVAYAEATSFDTATKTLTIKWDNLFPCINFCIDFLWHYDGSIPVKINDIVFTADDDSDPLIEDLLHGAIMVRADANGDPVNADGNVINSGLDPSEVVMTYPADIVIVDEGTQLHWCDYVYGVVTLHIPQNDIYMDLDGGATLTIDMVQWNKFVLVD